MARYAKIIVALLCLVCVLALCVAPYVDIPVTALKSLQVALLMILSLVAAALLFIGSVFFSLPVFRRNILPGSRATSIRHFLPPIETNCVQRC
jgi:hypothetical protein